MEKLFFEADEDKAKAFIGKLIKKYNNRQKEVKNIFDTIKKRFDEWKLFYKENSGQDWD